MGSVDPLGGSPLASPDSGNDGARPPLALLLAAVLLPAVTLPFVLLDYHQWGWHVVCWAVATFGTAALLIAFTLSDTRRRASAWYLNRDALVGVLRVAALVLALLAAVGHSWQFADWFSRLGLFA